MQKTPTIFLSYCHANADVADAIDNDFKSIGITFRRDIRDVAYRSKFKDFMNTISESDFVLMLISDEFLKSEWCLYEVTELLNTHKFDNKILPVILDNANSVFKLKGRLPYYEYWNNLVEEHNQSVAKYPNADLIEVLRRYKNIVNHLNSFFINITELNLLSVQALKEQNYRPILDLVGFDDKQLLAEVLAIWQTTDQDEREEALDDFGIKYPNSQYYFFSKAFFVAQEKNFKKAKKYFERAIQINPQYAEAHYNLGVILADPFKEYRKAEAHYLETIKIYPEYIDAYNNLGNLMAEHSKNYDRAKTYYDQALRIDPDDSYTHYNLGKLLRDHFQNYEDSKFHFLKAVKIDPENFHAYNSLGLLLAECSQDYESAKTNYLEALRINPEFVGSYNNLGNLLANHFHDYEGAKKQYLAALDIDSTDPYTHFNLGCLLA